MGNGSFGSKLVAKQQLFVEEYLIDYNATAACIRAGYSAKNASKIGPELLGKPRIRLELNKRQAEISKKYGASKERLINQLSKVIFTPMNEIIDDKGDLRVDADTTLVQEVKTNRLGTTIKTLDRMKAIELLCKHLGITSDTIKIEGSLNLSHLSDEELKKIIDS